MNGVQRSVVLCIALRFLSGGPAAALSDEGSSSDVRLALPPAAYAVAGAEISVYFDNIVLTPQPSDVRFVVSCRIGRTEVNRWTATPTESDVGDHPWSVEVFRGDQAIAKGTMTWHVSSASAGKQRRFRLLLVGDSLTHATVYANDLARRLSAPDQPEWTMLGTHRPPAASPGVAHEGYGGWTWERFVRHYDPMPDPRQRRYSSPFVSLVDGRPQLDIARYVRESCGGHSPDCVLFLLGINDCFAANPDDPIALEAHIDRVFGHAETLLKAFRAAVPEAQLGVCLTPPPNARESGFEASYQGRYHRWGWKRIQHRLVERELQQFSHRERDRIYVVPTQLNLDPVLGYPVDNGVHPNELGYQQLAASLHAWLLARLQATDASATN